MTVYVQFSIFFLQLIFASAELIAGILLGREALRRRGQRHLPLFSVNFIILGIGALLSFLGGFFDSQGFIGTGQILSSLFVIFTIVGSFFYALAFTELYVRGVRKVILNVVMLVTAVVALIISDKVSTAAFGVYLPIGTASSFIFSYGYWLIVNAFGAYLAVLSCRRSRRHNSIACEADRFLVVGSMVAVAAGLLTVMLVRADLWGGAILVYATLTLMVVYKYLGANAKSHPDPVVAQHPYNAVRGSLMGKVLIVSALFFALLTFVLLASTSNFFVERSLFEQKARVHDALDRTVSDLRTMQEEALYDVVLLAAVGDTKMTQDLIAVADTAEKAGMRGHDRWIDLVDQSGTIVASTSSAPAGSQYLSMSQAVSESLGGKSTTAIEWDEIVGTWVVRASSPLKGGAVVISRPILDWALPICLTGQMFPADGCGLVSASGEPIITFGEVPDALTLERFRTSVAPTTGFGGGESDLYFSYDVRSLEGADGGYAGFAYTITSRTSIEDDLFRILSAVVVVMVLFLVIAMIMLAFGMALILRPLRMLKAVAERVSGGDYGVSVDYDSPDEMGRLAAAFNHMSETIRDRTRMLNERVREQRDSLIHTAHEIRTPLNIFRWSLEMLRFGDTGKLNNEQMELLEQMHQTNERIRVMVDELLVVSRMDKGTVRTVKEPVSVEEVIDEVAGELSVRIREKMIDFYWKHPEGGLPKVLADRKRLFEIVMNLIGNAVKFTGKEGHIFVTASESGVSGPEGRGGRFIHVQIEDNGRGIPDDQHKSVFRRFFRARNVLGEDIGGTGLGLYITKKLVDIHGGEIWFESEENSGSTFHFTIPIADGK